MRMPNEGENLVGKICVCSVGRPFIVTGTKQFEWGPAWVGLGLDGKGTVASSEPCIIAESGQEFHNKLFELFGGKMSYNG
jgi:hypothetical protein